MTTYTGRHRDDSPDAQAWSRVLDQEARWSALYPCTHHHARHTAFGCKVRGL